MNYYNEIKENLIKCEIYDKAKNYSKDRYILDLTNSPYYIVR